MSTAVGPIYFGRVLFDNWTSVMKGETPQTEMKTRVLFTVLMVRVSVIWTCVILFTCSLSSLRNLHDYSHYTLTFLSKLH